MKYSFLINILEQFAVLTLGFLFFEVVFITLGYFARITINEFTFAVSFFVYFGAIFIWKFTQQTKLVIHSFSVYLSRFFLLFSIFLSIIFFSHFYDTSYDGRGYHSIGILSLSNGWNPLYEKALPRSIPGFSPQTFVHMGDQSGEIFARGYPKALWMIQSAIYQLTKQYYSLSVTNFIIAVLAITLVYTLFHKLKIPIIVSIILSLLLATELHFIIQFFTLMQDGFSYELILCSIALLGIYILDKSKVSLFGFIISSLFLAVVKYSNLPVLVLLVGIISFLWIKGDVIFFGVKRNILFSLACLLFLLLPYTTNTFYYGSSIYPSNLLGIRDSYARDGVPANLKHANKLSLLYYGMFSSIQYVFHSNGTQDRVSIKIPFTFSKLELENLLSFDTSNSSYGVFFSGAILLSLVIFIVAYNYIEQKNYFYLTIIFIGLILLSALISPVPNVSRYNTQLFILPFVVIVFMFSFMKPKLFYFFGVVLTLIMIVNNFIYIYQYVNRQPQITQAINYQLIGFKNSGKTYEIAPITTKADTFFSDYIKLQEMDIPIKIVKSISCKEPVLLSYTYNASNVCPISD